MPAAFESSFQFAFHYGMRAMLGHAGVWDGSIAWLRSSADIMPSPWYGAQHPVVLEQMQLGSLAWSVKRWPQLRSAVQGDSTQITPAQAINANFAKPNPMATHRSPHLFVTAWALKDARSSVLGHSKSHGQVRAASPGSLTPAKFSQTHRRMPAQATDLR